MKSTLRSRTSPARTMRFAREIALALAITVAAVTVFLLSRERDSEMASARPSATQPTQSE